MELTDLYWLAGLVEGEGCYRAQGGALALQIAMTDRDVIERAAKMLSTRVYVQEKAVPRQRMYATVVSGPRAAGWMMTLYSLMGERRRSKIADCLGQWRAATRKRTHCRKGHALEGRNLYQYTSKRQTFDGRGCRTCRNEYSRIRQREVRAALRPTKEA